MEDTIKGIWKELFNTIINIKMYMKNLEYNNNNNRCKDLNQQLWINHIMPNRDQWVGKDDYDIKISSFYNAH